MMYTVISILGLLIQFAFVGTIEQPQKYVFKKERVKAVSFLNLNYYTREGHKEHDMGTWSPNVRQRFCESVKEENPFISASDTNFIERAARYEVEEFNGRQKVEVAIKCPFIPEMWFYFGLLPNEIIMMFVPHVAEHYVFIPDFVNSVEPMHSNDPAFKEYRQSKVEKNYLGTLYAPDRNHFCFWAHAQLDTFTDEQRKENLNTGIISDSLASLYEVCKGNEKSEHVAIECRTIPKMYLRLEGSNADHNPNEMIAMIVGIGIEQTLPAAQKEM